MTEKKLDTSRPFRRADALTDGITAKELRGPRFRTIFRGVLINACVKVTPKLRAEAALRLFDPTAFASHASAARLLDVPVPTLPDEHVTVFHQRMRRHHRGVRTHVSATMDVRKVNGVLLSDYARMFVELAELIGLVDLVVVGDHLVRKGRITPAELVSYCAASRHRAARAARRAVAYVRPDVDSPDGDAPAHADRPRRAPRARDQRQDPGGRRRGDAPLRPQLPGGAGHRGVRRAPAHRTGRGTGVRPRTPRGHR
ncbi:hypothetical protein [Nocardioides sp. B-3]|uniref:hypothetical protein n=1 Tax=Nocardioides sp. B-3 TaxID=2895565 RepID=UPI002153A224|nr:hypothetical protein [Nocardioides sp. B-3]UUZ60995.1 hypothetical protein LP418_10110 [Nocardioides sp. B-3]